MFPVCKEVHQCPVICGNLYHFIVNWWWSLVLYPLSRQSFKIMIHLRYGLFCFNVPEVLSTGVLYFNAYGCQRAVELKRRHFTGQGCAGFLYDILFWCKFEDTRCVRVVIYVSDTRVDLNQVCRSTMARC